METPLETSGEREKGGQPPNLWPARLTWMAKPSDGVLLSKGILGDGPPGRLCLRALGSEWVRPQRQPASLGGFFGGRPQPNDGDFR